MPAIEENRIDRFVNSIEDLVMNNTSGPEEFELYMCMLAQEFSNRYLEDEDGRPTEPANSGSAIETRRIDEGHASKAPRDDGAPAQRGATKEEQTSVIREAVAYAFLIEEPTYEAAVEAARYARLLRMPS